MQNLSNLDKRNDIRWFSWLHCRLLKPTWVHPRNVMIFLHAKEVEEIGLTNQPCKSSKICLIIPTEEAMPHLVFSASFAFADKRKSR
jgi:hypothetical protein